MRFVPSYLGTSTPDITLSGDDGADLNVGAGGELGSAAFTDSEEYEPAIEEGTTGQFWRGDKTWTAIPGIPVIASTSSVLKGDGTGNAIAAVAGTDFLTPTGSGTGLTGVLKTANNLSEVTPATARANLVLGNVDNTSDVNKPVSTAQAAADTVVANAAAAALAAHTGNTSNPHSVTKAQVGLGSADNTSDVNKPVSTATQTALDLKVDENASITGDTKTKITYDTKGLVTAGTDATTADVADSSNRRYLTDAQLVIVGNTSGTNTGNQTSIVGITGTIAQFNTSITDGDLSTGGGTATGVNTGDQTSIVGITGTTTQFNTALTDGDFATGGGTASGTNTGDQTSVTGNAGTATALQNARTIAITGDLAWTSPSFNGSGNVTAAGTLATVNGNVGAFGSSTAIPTVTANAKGLITAVSTNAVVAPAGTLTGATLASGVTASSLTSFGSSPTLVTPVITQTSYTAPTLLNSWVNFDAANYEAAGYMKDSMGFTHIAGLIKSGSVGAAAFTLPAGFRPTKNRHFPAASNNAYGQVYILTDGNVHIEIGSNVWFSFGEITFKAA